MLIKTARNSIVNISEINYLTLKSLPNGDFVVEMLFTFKPEKEFLVLESKSAADREFEKVCSCKDFEIFIDHQSGTKFGFNMKRTRVISKKDDLAIRFRFPNEEAGKVDIYFPDNKERENQWKKLLEMCEQ